MANEKRLIDANALYAKLGKMAREPYYQHNGEDYYVGIADAAGEVAGAPTVDAVEVVHGRWEGIEFDMFYKCSNCGLIVEYELSKYCPNCGAKMDGDGNG
jgi:rubrerythrin